MLIKGRKEEIILTIDSKEKADIMKKLMEMEGVKTINPENSHIKVDSLSTDQEEKLLAEGYKHNKENERYDDFEAPDSGADVPEDGF